MFDHTSQRSHTKPLSPLPAQPRNVLHAFFLDECLLIISAALAISFFLFEISVIVGYGEEILREIHYLWGVNWFLAAWIGLQFCALIVHHWDCWMEDKRRARMTQEVSFVV